MKQRLKQAKQEYERLLTKDGRSEKETLHMIKNGVFLIEENIFTHKLLPKLRGFIKSLKTSSTIELLARIAALENTNT